MHCLYFTNFYHFLRITCTVILICWLLVFLGFPLHIKFMYILCIIFFSSLPFVLWIMIMLIIL